MTVFIIQLSSQHLEPRKM